MISPQNFVPEEITYLLFGINPEEYYRKRFFEKTKLDVKAENLAIRKTIIYQKSQYLIDLIKQLGGEHQQLKVLDVGCGSGFIGARVKHFIPNTQLFGIDMSGDCINTAKRNGYDHVMAHNVINNLPYAADSFDLVFTMDFFGHVEFRYKDNIISEIHRVTKKGGHGFHGIEAGFINYFTCNPKDPHDPVRKYVHIEGHIGVEPLEDIARRFSQHFNILSAFPWPIRPFLNIDNILAANVWGEEFTKAFSMVDSSNSRIAADLVLGHCTKYFTDLLMKIYGTVLTKDHMHQKEGGKIVAEELLQGMGFAIITMIKP
ncbi:class I SAM-dependent methyltransferase [Desulforamulus ferrireducens]|uniref:Methyltransferase domain-containing protein n=1 Tax=Desulforamulus ferrireducens TaxID=1833852 RepID=A0A1S6IVL7_9FIRM|nr:class I SAM-dependent methyltransferase [Desulforamulus ferrireducens]AQS58806.1 hypothetical protein B0537_06750 [Desulforamulus ferrireducens]